MTHFSLLTDFDISLFKTGKHFRLYEKLGSHLISAEKHSHLTGFTEGGVYFAVWCPAAVKVSVVGNFNGWNKTANPMNIRWDGSGIWEIFIPKLEQGEVYKYAIEAYNGRELEKADPYAFRCECPPQTASVVWDLNYTWKDTDWLEKRRASAGKPQPMSVYELHLGSWQRNAYENNRSLTYQEMATQLVDYVRDMGFTHVEFMPVMEHPYEPSWGYQVLGYFAPTSRFGSPQDFMTLVDAFHTAGIGVILDWVPSHFPMDAHGLYDFDGTSVYEHPDKRKGYHPDWKSAIFNYGRNEVRSFLISNALFWLDKYHVEGLRVDAVASMLYLDYSRNHGEWEANIYGGNENLEAISFLKEMNETVRLNYPDVVTIAEESTSFWGVSRPVSEGGLGFHQKWMMGWMHDTLGYFKRESKYRSWHQNEITFSFTYAFSENFMLPLSHDEVVYGKGSLLGRMQGDETERFANLRAMFGYMFTHPGTRLVFMGGEFGQGGEWAFEGSLAWWVLDSPYHKGIQTLVKDLNGLNKSKSSIYEKAFSSEGFEWVAGDDTQNAVITFLRKGNDAEKTLLVVCHFKPELIENYHVGVPIAGLWREILNTDHEKYAGNHQLNEGDLVTTDIEAHGRKQSLNLRIPPLATMVFEYIAPQKAPEVIQEIAEKPKQKRASTKTKAQTTDVATQTATEKPKRKRANAKAK
jgi:1,4-alpha-glucan branching enzyme